MSNRTRLWHAVLAGIPVLLSPALLFALAEGWVGSGGGERNVLLIFPYFIWALAFFFSALVLIVKHWTLGRWLKRAAVVSTALMFLLAIAAYVTSGLGVA